MLMRYPLAGVILCVVCIVFSVSITIAAECQQRDNFSDWLEHFRQEATSQDISQQTIMSALNGRKIAQSSAGRPFANGRA